MAGADIVDATVEALRAKYAGAARARDEVAAAIGSEEARSRRRPGDPAPNVV